MAVTIPSLPASGISTSAGERPAARNRAWSADYGSFEEVRTFLPVTAATLRKRAEEQILHDALHDPLTDAAVTEFTRAAQADIAPG